MFTWLSKHTPLAAQDMRDAARLGLQSALAAALVFTIMQSFDMPEKFVAILSAVLVVQPSVGRTASEGWDRLLATLVGSLVGIATYTLLPAGYGTLAALVVAMLVINAIAAFRPDWRYGVVAAVALSLGDGDRNLEAALDRLIAIGLGFAGGLAVSLLIWPDSASSRTRRYGREVLKGICQRLETALQPERVETDEDGARQHVQGHLSSARQSVRGMKGETGRRTRDSLDRLEAAYTLVLMLDRAGDRLRSSKFDTSRLDDDLERVRETGTCALDRLGEDAEHEKQAGDSSEEDQSDTDELTAFRDAIDNLGDTLERMDFDKRTALNARALTFALCELGDLLEDWSEDRPLQKTTSATGSTKEMVEEVTPGNPI